MPEPAPIERVCPYLRGRHWPAPVLQPSPHNHCILAASIHLPQTQQGRYCLGGRHAQCPRFQRQAEAPLPRYITGVPTAPPPPLPAPPELGTILWRRPITRTILRWLLVAVLVALLVSGWRWRQNSLTPRLTPRPPLPTAIAPLPDPGPNPFAPSKLVPGSR